ncbi:DUF7577 domain-containing protein [Haloferacaceae archaeon DSL9]
MESQLILGIAIVAALFVVGVGVQLIRQEWRRSRKQAAWVAADAESAGGVASAHEDGQSTATAGDGGTRTGCACPRCGVENESTYLFCRQCVTPLR